MNLTQLELWPVDAGQLALFGQDEEVELRIRTAGPAELRASSGPDDVEEEDERERGEERAS